MPVLPKRVTDFLNFMEVRGEPWSQSAAALGLSQQQADACRDLAVLAREKLLAQMAAASAARVATAAARATFREAHEAFAEAIKTIKAFAETQGEPSAVYNLAMIPQPAAQSPLPPPGAPRDLRATLESDGSLTLRWKADSPPGASGTVWRVGRRIGASGPFEFVGIAGSRIFTDETIPAGATEVQYSIHGQRGKAVGPSCYPFNVRFGRDGGRVSIRAAGSKLAA